MADRGPRGAMARVVQSKVPIDFEEPNSEEDCYGPSNGCMVHGNWHQGENAFKSGGKPAKFDVKFPCNLC